MGLPCSIEKIYGWETQYAQMLRWRDRVNTSYSDGRMVSDDAEDFLLAFFESCYHLKDFVIETGSISASDINAIINTNHSMRICRDICNRAKHHTLRHHASVDKDWSLGREYAPWPDGTDGIGSYLLVGSDKLNPVDTVHECVAFWSGLVEAGRFQPVSNPFQRSDSN